MFSDQDGTICNVSLLIKTNSDSQMKSTLNKPIHKIMLLKKADSVQFPNIESRSSTVLVMK